MSIFTLKDISTNDLFSQAQCNEAARKLGLREVAKSEIEARGKASEEEYWESMKQLERKV